MRFKAFATAIILFILGRPAHAEAPVTFNNQVVRVFQQHCQTCHRPGEVAPFSLTTYPDAHARRDDIREAVEARHMPPWKRCPVTASSPTCAGSRRAISA